MSSKPSAVEVSDRAGDFGECCCSDQGSPEPSSANAPGGTEVDESIGDVVIGIYTGTCQSIVLKGTVGQASGASYQ